MLLVSGVFIYRENIDIKLLFNAELWACRIIGNTTTAGISIIAIKKQQPTYKLTYLTYNEETTLLKTNRSEKKP